jgi:hypothetical protein
VKCFNKTSKEQLKIFNSWMSKNHFPLYFFHTIIALAITSTMQKVTNNKNALNSNSRAGSGVINFLLSGQYATLMIVLHLMNKHHCFRYLNSILRWPEYLIFSSSNIFSQSSKGCLNYCKPCSLKIGLNISIINV